MNPCTFPLCRCENPTTCTGTRRDGTTTTQAAALEGAAQAEPARDQPYFMLKDADLDDLLNVTGDMLLHGGNQDTAMDWAMCLAKVEARLKADVAGAAQAEPVEHGELDPRRATEQAREMLRYVDSFNGQKFSALDDVDRQNLAVALDNLQETAAMLLNMADRVTHPHQPAQPVAVPQSSLPERDTTKSAEQQGVFRKFEVRRVDGSDAPGGKHHGCEYFVLDVDHDPCAKAALTAYADAVQATHPALADDMRNRYMLNDAPTPPAATVPVLEPLTDAEILSCLSAITHEAPDRLPQGWAKFARAVEAAHGITLPAEGNAS